MKHSSQDGTSGVKDLESEFTQKNLGEFATELQTVISISLAVKEILHYMNLSYSMKGKQQSRSLFLTLKMVTKCK